MAHFVSVNCRLISGSCQVFNGFGRLSKIVGSDFQPQKSSSQVLNAISQVENVESHEQICRQVNLGETSSWRFDSESYPMDNPVDDLTTHILYTSLIQRDLWLQPIRYTWFFSEWLQRLGPFSVILRYTNS